MLRVIAQFRDAAVRAHTAGFAGVELHGAHGYVLGQFLGAMNIRGDRWGGSLENRARLVREATRTVRGAVPASFLLGVRLSPEDYGNARGLDLDESLQVARWLAADGVDFLHVSLWDAQRNTKKRPDAHPVTLFREALPADVALVAAGGVWTRQEAESSSTSAPAPWPSAARRLLLTGAVDRRRKTGRRHHGRTWRLLPRRRMAVFAT